MVNLRLRALAQGVSIGVVGLLSLSTALPAQQHYKQTNLVSDTGVGGTQLDGNLVNAWGISRGSATPWWVSDNGMGVATLYDGTGTARSLVVTIPAADSSKTGTPTGQIFNGTTDFQLVKDKPAVFLFATEDGTISGWNPGVLPTTAKIMVNTKGASVFKGLAVATINDSSAGATNYLYAADFTGHVRVYDTNFHEIHLKGNAFSDERHHGYAPFNIQNIGGNLYVAFAKRGEGIDEAAGPGLGFVDVFSPTGRLLLRLESGKWFNAPWGLAQAPNDFGAYSHNILVGQFGSGEILAFDPVTGAFKGRLLDATNKPITIDGLWAIAFGGGNSNSGPSTSLFFTAGPNDENNGLFGAITAIENVLGGDH